MSQPVVISGSKLSESIDYTKTASFAEQSEKTSKVDVVPTWWDVIPDLGSALSAAWTKAYFQSGPEIVCPPANRTFRALEMTPPSEVKVVILGQDPYHTPGKASGLSFGYHRDWLGAPDSSLANIIVELGSPKLFDRSLEQWAKQGVLLLNTRLTVLTGKPLSHAYGTDSAPGWEKPVGLILSHLAQRKDVVWLLWGAEARSQAQKVGVRLMSPNTIITTHPCRFSNTKEPKPFTGSKCFDRANKRLLVLEKELIKWV